jgi:penicillin amidase
MLRSRRSLALLSALGFALASDCQSPPQVELALEGLEAPVRVRIDGNGVPHVFAETDTDMARVQGFVHARDRFWKMDITRRQVDGTSGELFGIDRLGDDIQMRTFGLHRAAARTLATLEPRELEVLQAYSAGVNAWIAEVRAGARPLPDEYAALELSAESLREWTPGDTLAIGKGIAASLSLDIDAGLVETLEAYCDAGAAATPPFDGAALLFQDVRRFAPMDPAATVLDATGTTPYTDAAPDPIACADAGVPVAAAKRFREKAEGAALLAKAMQRPERQIGSNEWGITADVAVGGVPIIANDPHLSLGTPPEFYENHLVVAADPVSGPMNVSGVTFPGVPFVILGQNERVTWGATTNPLDVTDLFADKLTKGRAGCLTPAGRPGTFCIESGGQLYPVVTLVLAPYMMNTPGDGTLDNLEDAGLSIADPGGVSFSVPFRSFGPIVDVEDPSIFLGGGVNETQVLTLQYTGFQATGEIRTFRLWNRAAGLADFLAGLEQFDVGGQNWAYADADGNVGYFTSAEVPLRKDLEDGSVFGLPPFFVRDGVSGENNWIADPARSQGQAIPFAILPYAEMPQTLNPANGFFSNANNDPAGTSLDNDVLNQRRLSNPDAIYYLSGGYDPGLRSGRITQLLRDRIQAGQQISIEDMKRFQTNTQERDAELMTPFLLAAFANAQAPGAPAELAAFAADAGVAEAVGRLAAWDWSTPTGLPEGWDAADELGVRGAVSAEEAAASVAATIYNVWRGKLIRAVIDARLSALGVPGVGSGDALRAVHHLLSRTPYTGVGHSGIDFVPTPAGLDAEDRRDVALLAALRSALDSLAGDAYAAAFGRSTDQDDYRWGRLHRVTFSHELGGDFSLPPYAGFQDVAPDLLGMARDGGYEVVNASGYSAKADGPNAFRFGGGPVRRYVGMADFPSTADGAVVGYNAVPSVVGTPPNTRQMRFWLTGDSHPVHMTESAVTPHTTRIETFSAPSEE